ncbi:MAG: response regulator, partial [Leptolyngbya sp. SIO3F4]|nr:response regulator [Leptolyngbya sp. SIO3F4]
LLSALQRQTYDVILMDVQMPEMDGLTATKLIHEKWPEQRPRIIAATANAMSGDREKFLAAGMDDYISKPIHIGELAQALERCFNSIPPSQATPSEKPNQKMIPLPEEISTLKQTKTDNQVIYWDLNILEQTLAPLGGVTSENLAPFLEIYAQESPQLIENLKTAIQTQDATKVEHAAHTLKSSSAALGLVEVQRLCQLMENESRNNNTALTDFIPQLEKALEEGMKHLQEIQ